MVKLHWGCHGQALLGRVSANNGMRHGRQYQKASSRRERNTPAAFLSPSMNDPGFLPASCSLLKIIHLAEETPLPAGDPADKATKVLKSQNA
jgi:hypothetical protein